MAAGRPSDPKDSSRAYVERPRRIPPELARDFVLELGCSILAALLLDRVIVSADDQGRMSGDPRYIRSTCFGMRDEITVAKVRKALDELVDGAFLIAYEADGRSYLQIRDWWGYQGAWGRRAYPSRHPAPPDWEDRVFGISKSRTVDPPLDAEADEQ